jgi:hypothetical protein
MGCWRQRYKGHEIKKALTEGVKASKMVPGIGLEPMTRGL